MSGRKRALRLEQQKRNAREVCPTGMPALQKPGLEYPFETKANIEMFTMSPELGTKEKITSRPLPKMSKHNMG